MLVIPAIDLQGGRCVRLRQGDMATATVYSDVPVDQARCFVEAGAKRLHVVDLDGAISGQPEHLSLISEIVRACPGIEIEVGGGIRSLQTIKRYLTIGVSYVILGTRAVEDADFVAQCCALFPEQIIVGLDANAEGKLATRGWEEVTMRPLHEVAQSFETMGVASLIYTDISRDGMLSSPNIEATVALCRTISIPVIASGGITNLHDIEMLCQVADEGILGVITGRAIYENTLSLVEAQHLANQYSREKTA